ncbi:MAG: GSCFA domain-containing protein [Paraprevotella clara]|nr:GSCFA domain-containing protein [Paraprevotella clara]
MDFYTKVKAGLPGLRIRPGDKILLLGSCFTDNIGRRMLQSGLDAHVNPFGVLYNPLSMATWCKAMATGEQLPEDIFFESGGMWHSWLNDSSFSALTEEGCRARVEEAYRMEEDRLKSLKVIFMTLGTNHCYRLNGNGRVVANCHKQPDSQFTEEKLGVEEVEEVLSGVLDALWGVNPDLWVVFTVSPYRYARYGFHCSQLAKATLLLAVSRVRRGRGKRCLYFPAYEIVMDELRDYRFYAADMLHLSEVGAEYVWRRLADICIPAETRDYMAEWEAVAKALSHRPLHPESAAYRDFLSQTMLKMERLVEKYPRLADTTEYGRLKGLLKY